MNYKKRLFSLLLILILFPISQSYAKVIQEKPNEFIENSPYNNFMMVETIPVYLYGKKQDLSEGYIINEIDNVNMEWDVQERAIYIDRNGEQSGVDREGILPITKTSIQISNYLLDGFVVEGVPYGFFHEIMDAIGATTFSGCMDLFILYHEEEYWLDLISGDVFVNGEQIPLELKPLFVGSELVIPLEFLSEVFAIKIEVLEEYNTVLVLQYYE